MDSITHLSQADIDHASQLLKDYPEAQPGLAMLKKHKGNPATSVEELVARRQSQTMQLMQRQQQRSVWQVFLEQLYVELCGEDDSLRDLVTQAKRNPDSSPLLTGLIVYLVNLAHLTINPAIAVVIALYILKIGISTFCEYTAQFQESQPQAREAWEPG